MGGIQPQCMACLARHGLFLVIALAIGRAVEPASIFNPTVFVGP